jgi:hypothetical protein
VSKVARICPLTCLENALKMTFAWRGYVARTRKGSTGALDGTA